MLSGHSEAFKEVVWHFDSPGRVALTIDDAPPLDPESCDSLLDMLDRVGVRVTFFVISSQCDTDFGKKFLEDAVARGHELGNHLVKDEPCNKKMTAEEFEDLLLACHSVIDGPKKPRWFRPPSGMMTPVMPDILAKHGYTAVLGDVYPLDVNLQDHPEALIAFCERLVQDGSVLILHTPSRDFRSTNFLVSVLFYYSHRSWRP